MSFLLTHIQLSASGRRGRNGLPAAPPADQVRAPDNAPASPWGSARIAEPLARVRRSRQLGARVSGNANHVSMMEVRSEGGSRGREELNNIKKSKEAFTPEAKSG